MGEIGRPNAHKLTHQNGGSDELDLTGLTRSPVFVDRGDPAAYDFTQPDITIDEAWHDLDLSAVVPAGAIAVFFSALLNVTGVGSTLLFRPNGQANQINRSQIVIQAANVNFGQDMIVALDSGRIIEYLASGGAFTSISIIIRGWWV
jgi:hypothetical protein